jgi:hypothetical protein
MISVPVDDSNARTLTLLPWSPPETLKLETKYFKRYGWDHVGTVSLVAAKPNYYRVELSQEPYTEDLGNGCSVMHPTIVKIVVTYSTLDEAKDGLTREIRRYCT